MTIQQAKLLHPGDTFRATPSTGQPRRYEVVSVDILDLVVIDEYRYSSHLPFGSLYVKQFLAKAELVKVQQ